MSRKKLSGLHIALILLLVAVVAVTLAVMTAEHVSPIVILIIAGVVVIASIVLNRYISAQRRRLDQESSNVDRPD